MIIKEYNAIGIMSGTSLDGIDLVYVNFVFNASWDFKIECAETIKYSKDWKSTLSSLVNKSRTDLKEIDLAYSKHLALTVKRFIRKNGITKIDFISSHGHTALHEPENGLTYQIGNSQVLADEIGLKVICDFRVQDVELGGQGAPLVPVGDRHLFSDYDFCLNLGGFANISYEFNTNRIAFDICPVNIVLNHYASKLGFDYDNGGRLAGSGELNNRLFEALNNLNFYYYNPPKSLSLEWVLKYIFPLIENYESDPKNILRTFVEHVAFQISRVINVKDCTVLVSGGGVYNYFLMDRLTAYSEAKIITPSKSIIEFKEALVFAFLGVLKDRDEINCLKSVTGARRDHSSGRVLLPKNTV